MYGIGSSMSTLPPIVHYNDAAVMIHSFPWFRPLYASASHVPIRCSRARRRRRCALKQIRIETSAQTRRLYRDQSAPGHVIAPPACRRWETQRGDSQYIRHTAQRSPKATSGLVNAVWLLCLHSLLRNGSKNCKCMCQLTAVSL